MNAQGTVFVVDDDPAMRDSLRWLLESVDLEVRTFESAGRFLEVLERIRPSCLVLDVRMPGLSGLDLQAELVRREVGMPVIMISGHGDVPVAVRAMRAGAIDFIEKPFSDQLLLDRVRQAIERDRTESASDSRRAHVESRAAQLTPREREVMNLVVSGRANRQIAEDLGLSQKTVEIHRARVMAKMEVDSLAELVRDVLLVSGPA